MSSVILSRRLARPKDSFLPFRRMISSISPTFGAKVDYQAKKNLADALKNQQSSWLKPRQIDMSTQIGANVDALLKVGKKPVQLSLLATCAFGFSSLLGSYATAFWSRLVARESTELSRTTETVPGAAILFGSPATTHYSNQTSSYKVHFSIPTDISAPAQSSRSVEFSRRDFRAPFPAFHPFIPSPIAPPIFSLTRNITTIANNRKTNLGAIYGLDNVVPLHRVMEDLRDLELLDKLRDRKSKTATGYKDAIRALYPLWHTVDQTGKEVTLQEVMDCLPPVYSVPWLKITEVLLEKKASELKMLDKEEKACVQFMRIYNIGPKRARDFYAAGAKTLASLQKLHDQGKIKLQRAQAIGLDLIDDFERLIPRHEMDQLRSNILEVIGGIKTVAKTMQIGLKNVPFEAEVLGSYRRGLDFASDIDLALRHPAFASNDEIDKAKVLLAKVVSALEDEGLIDPKYMLGHGEKKYSGLIKLPDSKHWRRIDIRLGPYDSYPYMLLGGSGDALLMKLLRHRAKQRGMCLNEYGMGDKHDAMDENPNGFIVGTLRVVKDEREIFDLLGVPYLEPEEREYAIWRPRYLKAGIDLSNVDKL